MSAGKAAAKHAVAMILAYLNSNCSKHGGKEGSSVFSVLIICTRKCTRNLRKANLSVENPASNLKEAINFCGDSLKFEDQYGIHIKDALARVWLRNTS